MYQIDNSTASASEPTRGGAGVKPDAFFQDSASGGTIVPAEFLNALMKELVYVVEQSGGTLDKADDTQVHEAINAMIASTANPFVNYAMLKYTEATGVTGQSVSVGQNTLELNTTVINNIAGTSLNGTTFALDNLPAGTYRVQATCYFSGPSAVQYMRLNVHDGSSVVANGLSSRQGSENDDGSVIMNDVFTIASTKSITLGLYISGSNTVGVPVNDGEEEEYAVLEIWKL